MEMSYTANGRGEAGGCQQEAITRSAGGSHILHLMKDLDGAGRFDILHLIQH